MISDILVQTVGAARRLIASEEFTSCERPLREALRDFPDEAVPQNLLGLLCEKQGDHTRAMKHFRAALGLDPTYLPAQDNLDGFGAQDRSAPYIFDESDYAPIPARARAFGQEPLPRAAGAR